MNQKLVLKNNIFLGYVFLAVISFTYGLINTNLEIRDTVSTAIIFVEIIILVFFLLSQRYTIKIFLGIILLLSIAFVTYITTGETVFLIMLIVAIIFSSLKYENAFRFIFFERLLIFTGIVGFSLIGILPVNDVSILKGGTASAIVGYGLGYNHPNQLAYEIGFLILLYMCWKNERLKQRNIMAMSVFSAIGYLITRSRTLLLIMCMVIIMLEFYKVKWTHNLAKKVYDLAAVWIMPLCTLIALGLPLLMTAIQGKAKIILYALNGIMGSRFTHSARVFENYPLTLFGGVTDFDILQRLYGYSIVDNGYLRLLYSFGMIGFSIFLILYILAIKKIVKRRQYIFLIAIFAISLWGISESILRSFAINFTVAFWGVLLQKEDRVIKKRKRFKL